MIGKLKGILDSIQQDRVILDVSGVGYIINCSNKTLLEIPETGKQASFLTNMQVKEDDISLYGFIKEKEQEWFNLLITVQGIGPRLALVILSNLNPDQLVQVILEKNKEAFKHISGVGPKVAERIFTELNKKADKYSSNNPNSNSNAIATGKNQDNINDALVALTNLGYSKSSVYNICNNIYNNNPNISINDLIKLSLKELSS